MASLPTCGQYCRAAAKLITELGPIWSFLDVLVAQLVHEASEASQQGVTGPLGWSLRPHLLPNLSLPTHPLMCLGWLSGAKASRW